MRNRWSRLGLLLSLAVGLLAIPGLVHAHSPIPNIGFFYSGVLHPLRVAEQLMALLALAALIGQTGLTASRLDLIGLLTGLLVGLPLLIYGTPMTARISELVLLSMAACTGIVVAGAITMPERLLALWSFVISMAVMTGSLQEGVPEKHFALATLGVAIGTVIFVMVVASWIDLLKRAPARIGVRVLGSWLAAAALMVLALSIRALKNTS